MTKMEREISRRLGIAPEDYIQTKRLSINSSARGAGAKLGLSETEIAVCARLGNTPADYLLCKARRLLSQARGEPGVAVNYSMRGPNSRQAVDEAADAMRESGELPYHKETVPRAALFAQAQAELAAFEANPDAPDAWRLLARAIVFLEEAAQLQTPAWIDRHPSRGTAEDDEEEDDTEGAQNPFTSAQVSRIVDKAVERMIGPLLQQARQERQEIARRSGGVATVARPLVTASATQETDDVPGRLTALEMEVCRRLGNSPADYLRDKARRGLMTR